MAQMDPVSTALLSLYEIHAARRQAELDLERAQAREAIEGRAAVPGVFAQLQQQAQKEQAQRERIAKAGEPAPQAMLPPLTDVTGQAQPRSAAAGLKAAGELLEAVLGGRTARTMGPLAGGFPSLPAPGTTPVFSPAAGPTPTAQRVGVGQQTGAPGQLPPIPPPSPAPQPSPPGAPPPGTPPPAPTVGLPGTVQLETVPLETKQKVLRGIAGAGAALLRQPGMAVNLLEEAIRGEQVVGTRQVPTLEQIGAVYGPGLAELEALRQRASDPTIAAEADILYQNKVAEVIERYGPEAGAYVVDTATTLRLEQLRLEEQRKEAEERAYADRIRGGKELATFRAGLEREQAAFQSGLERANQMAAEQRKAATPEGMARTELARARLKAYAEGWDSLSPGERIAVGGQPEIARTVKGELPDLTPAAKSALQAKVDKTRRVQALAQDLKAKWFPEYYQRSSGAQFAYLKAKENAAKLLPGIAGVDEKEQAFLRRYADMEQAQSMLSGGRMREEIGSQRTVPEIELMVKQVPDESDSQTTAAQKLDNLIEMLGLDALQTEITLRLGYTPQEGSQAYSFADMRKMVRTFAEAQIGDMTGQGVEPLEAERRMKQFLLDQYGLDLDRY